MMMAESGNSNRTTPTHPAPAHEQCPTKAAVGTNPSALTKRTEVVVGCQVSRTRATVRKNRSMHENQGGNKQQL
ncbi:hypothetical protein MPTK1_7g02990 [Marchantia polymorpha subsp. ruderalis]|uniref:Uncharacterized protein n=2 Tax=Marchantia polymorpha TaxID=3197 RepID=A0AAF6BVK8_MARPO|nr:hypothetical protein MARPO_0524s0001 [Marchantia polymorpha]BBN16042.1 hypothetical protein Mp_7g02990 [Marchantia polymorpha subsp. ruderalis]|eukprot:PTQ26719.1 hypothetical protein MARPO_0524s0001 [Marchantia polymorpha]